MPPPAMLGRTIFITGASRGIGKAIALRMARDGANVVLTGRSLDSPSHAELDGTLQETAEMVRQLGGTPLALQLDVRDPHMIEDAAQEAAHTFGGIDVLVNNASAIDLSPNPTVQSMDLMHSVNVRGTALCTMRCLPYLRRSPIGHVLALAPPLRRLERRWLAPHLPYTMSKYGMTMCMMAHANKTICANTLWPRRVVATAATRMLEEQTGHPVYTQGRPASYVAEAVHKLVQTNMSGHMLLDEDLMAPQLYGHAPLDLFCD